MSDYKVGDRVLVKLSGGRIVEATINAVVETHTYIRGHHGKRHLPTLLSLVTEAISKLP